MQSQPTYCRRKTARSGLVIHQYPVNGYVRKPQLGFLRLQGGHQRRPAFTQLRGLFSEDGTPLHNYASYLGVADLAAAAVRSDRRMEGCGVIERAFSRLDGTASARIEQLIVRARGILAGPDGAEAHFGKALADPPWTSGHSSGHSFASTTPSGCGGAAGSTTPNPF